MRFARHVSLALIALMLIVSAAKADDGGQRNFGSVTCPNVFSCDNVNSITSAAASCTMSGLGRQADFSNASVDSNNCMASAFYGDGGQNSSNVVCCAKPVEDQDGMCRMACSLMFGGSH